MYRGFDPVFDSNSKILILGSFPSVKSREVGFYYGNARNRFWRIVSSAFGEYAGDTIEDKISFLLRYNIALWDIASSCDIVGSLDSNIRNPIISDVRKLVNSTSIRKILCNGSKSYSLLCRQFPELCVIATKLPSTSPANFKFNADEWFSALRSSVTEII